MCDTVVMPDPSTPATPEPKAPWESMTLWGGVFTALGVILVSAKAISPETAAVMTSVLPEVVIGVIGVILTWTGRVRASQPIGLSGGRFAS